MEQALMLIVGLFVLEVVFGYWLEYLNISHIEKAGSIIPPEFEGHIDQGVLTRTRDYTVEHTRFGIVASVVNTVVILTFLFGGILPAYDSWVASLKLPFVLSGLIFFLLLSCASTVLSIPFSLYRSFRIEKKYGFNTMTPKLWVIDFIKSLLLSLSLMGILIAAGLWIIQASPGFWWFWAWTLFFAFTIFIMYISPYVIEPLFNKFEPIEDETLAEGIRRLAGKAGIRVSRISRMDASKRTKHTNAYFTGIGKVKRIVIYDTLLERMEKSEILAVLAHEIGHWKKRHLVKYLASVETLSLGIMYGSFELLKSNFFAGLFRIGNATLYTKLLFLVFFGSLVLFPLEPIFHYFSRKHEREADRFSHELTGDAGSMISTLVKLSKDNLSNLHPHPLYAAFHYSHPPVTERIRLIRGHDDKSR
ncbi:MAG: M48 family metallopeptidase [bacterium]